MKLLVIKEKSVDGRALAKYPCGYVVSRVAIDFRFGSLLINQDNFIDEVLSQGLCVASL